MKKIDYVKLFSNDLIGKIYDHILKVQESVKYDFLNKIISFADYILNVLKISSDKQFKLNECEINLNKEADYLRSILDLFLLTVFSEKNYFRNPAIRSIFREVLLTKG